MKLKPYMDAGTRFLGRPFVKGSSKKGMTLIEIIIVVALLGTLMAILVRNLTKSADEARIDQAKIGMQSLEQNLQMFRIHTNKYPTTAQGLDALVRDPGGNKKWRGPYTEENKLVDPWGTKFQYESDGSRSYRITSAGPDQTFGTADDISIPEGSSGGGEGGNSGGDAGGSAE